MEAPRQPRSGHPVAAAVACVHEALDSVADAPVWSLTEAEAGATLLELGAEIDRLQRAPAAGRRARSQHRGR